MNTFFVEARIHRTFTRAEMSLVRTNRPGMTITNCEPSPMASLHSTDPEDQVLRGYLACTHRAATAAEAEDYMQGVARAIVDAGHVHALQSRLVCPGDA